MAEVLLFHHVGGLTAGLHALADRWRDAGHTVHTPDLFNGRTFDTVDAGLDFVRDSGFADLVERGVGVADGLPPALVYAGYSFGVMPAQQLAQTRPGALGALLFESCAPTSEFGDGWPADVPVQIHGMDADAFFVGEGDVDAARQLVAEADDGELFLYPGDGHLFADPGFPAYDADAAALLGQRVLDFLAAR